MEELIKAMSDEDLVALKDKYADNPSVATLIEGILETRNKEAEQVKAKAQFASGLSKLLAKLPHPEDVHNIYIRWAEVDVPIEGGVAEDVDVVDADGNTTTESRIPMGKEFQWVVEVNKGFTVNRSASGSPSTSKRAITVYKRNGTQLEDKGQYASASKACEVFGLTIGGDSAMRVLAREGYITEPYEGTNTTS